MNGCFFIEGRPYTERDLARACVDGLPWREPSEDDPTADTTTPTVTTADTTKIISRLRSMKVGARPMLSRTAAGLTFNYVGVVALFRHVFIVLPKYYVTTDGQTSADMTWLASTMHNVRGAIRRHYDLRPSDRLQDRLRFDDSDAKRTVIIQSRLDLYRFLLDDFAEHHEYREPQRIREFNGDGEIDWIHTVNRIVPMIDAGRPAYMETITTRRKRSDSNFIARVQRAVISELSLMLEETGLDSVLQLTTFPIPAEKIDNIGDREFLASRMDRELTVHFDTRAKRLLRALADYLRDGAPASESPIIAEGTGSFNLVWESICQHVFHNHHDDTDMPNPQWRFRKNSAISWDRNVSPSTNKPSTNEIVTTENVLQPGTESPIEEDDDSTGTAQTHKLIPDVINKDDPNGWYILDAKYYTPQYAGALKGVPGVQDVIKQYFYMMASRNRDKNRKVLGNAFVVPGRIPVAQAFPEATVPNTPLGQTSSGNGTGDATVESHTGRWFLQHRGNVSLDFIGSFLGVGEDVNAIVRMFEMEPEQAIRMFIDTSSRQNRPLDYLSAMFTPINGSEEFVLPIAAFRSPSTTD